MKIGKTRNKSGILKVLLGLAVAGALLFTSCQNIFDVPGQTQKDDGYGTVVVDLDLGEAARTIRPELGQVTHYVYHFYGVDVLNVDDIWYQSDNPNANAFRLPLGTYRLEVEAYVGAGLAAKGKFSGGDNGKFTIEANIQTKIAVVLTPETSGNGNLAIRIKLPADINGFSVNLSGIIDSFSYELRPYLGASGLLGTAVISNSTTPLTRTPTGVGSANGDITYTLGTWSGTPPTSTGATRAAGTYLFTARINTNDGRYGGFSEAVHVYPNMLTVFEKDYTALDALAQVTTAEEAYEILLDEIPNWLIDPEGDALATVGGGINTETAGVIRLDYVASRTNNPDGTLATSFPIRLQGGWDLKSPSTWDLGGSTAPKDVILVNAAVKARMGTGAADVTYTVTLRPVAEFTLAFDSTVESPVNSTRSVAVAVNGGATLSTLNSASPLSRTFIADAGSMDITIAETAIVMGVDGARPTPREPQTGSVYNFIAGSNRYNIIVYQTKVEQVSVAFTTLKANIVSWVEQQDALTYSPSNIANAAAPAVPGGRGSPEFSATTANNSAYGDYDKVTLYYVADRLDPSLPMNADFADQKFYIRMPEDPRWIVDFAWDLTGTGGGQTIKFQPSGGDPVPYVVELKPVAEFYVSFEEPPEVYPTSSKVTIKDTAGSGSITHDFTATSNTGKLFTLAGNDAYFGRKHILGPTDFTINDVTIMMDDTSLATALTDPFDYWYVAPPSGSTTPPAGPNVGPPASNALIAQSGTVQLTVTSREYHIKVYRTLAKQKTDAIADIKAQEGKADAAAWGFVDIPATTTPSVAPAQRVIHDDGLKPPSGTDIVTKLVYAGTEPTTGAGHTITIRQDTVTSGGSTTVTDDWGVPNAGNGYKGRGWSQITWVAADTDSTTHGTTTIRLAFTPKGGILEDTTTASADGIYRFQLIPAHLYTVTYMGYPIGDDPVTGTVTVVGSDFGTTTAINPVKPTYNGTVSTPEFIGLGTDIEVTGTASGNANVIQAKFDGATVGTYADATGKLTITKTTAANASVIANATPIDIRVYPSAADQKAGFLREIKKVTYKDLVAWTLDQSGAPAGPPTSLPLTPAASIQDDLPKVLADTATEYRIVATPIPYLKEPTGYLNEGYLALTIDNVLNGGTGSANPIVNGKKTVKVTFNTLQGTPGTQDYIFNLLAVAQYNIEFMKGPTGLDAPLVGLQIKTYKEGTPGTTVTNGENVDEKVIPINQQTTQLTYYGGIGSFLTTTTPPATAGNTKIVTAQGNVFATDYSGSYAVNGIADFPIEPVTSRVYNIRIYPRIVDQENAVLAKLNQLANTPAAAWFTNVSGGSATSNLYTPNFATGGTNILEVMYWGTAPATVVPVNNPAIRGDSIITPINATTADQATAGYTYALTAQAKAYETNRPTGSSYEFVPLKFTPVDVIPSGGGATEPTTARVIYNIRTIPLTKFTVTYANSATGTVTVTPDPNSNNQPAPPATPIPIIRPNAPLVFNASPDPVSKYIGQGDVDISISATASMYYEIQVKEKGGTTVLSKLASSATLGVVKFTSAELNTAFTSIGSKEYEIQVIQR
jgi:hypothetical protein